MRNETCIPQKDELPNSCCKRRGSIAEKYGLSFQLPVLLWKGLSLFTTTLLQHKGPHWVMNLWRFYVLGYNGDLANRFQNFQDTGVGVGWTSQNWGKILVVVDLWPSSLTERRARGIKAETRNFPQVRAEFLLLSRNSGAENRGPCSQSRPIWHHILCSLQPQFPYSSSLLSSSPVLPAIFVLSKYILLCRLYQFPAFL